MEFGLRLRLRLRVGLRLRLRLRLEKFCVFRRSKGRKDSSKNGRRKEDRKNRGIRKPSARERERERERERRKKAALIKKLTRVENVPKRVSGWTTRAYWETPWRRSRSTRPAFSSPVFPH